MRYFQNEQTKEISFPLGGIGTGSIGLGGNGRFLDWEIFNRPNKGSLNGYTHIAVRSKNAEGKMCAKVLCGDILKDYSGQYSKERFDGFGFGVSPYTMAGFPHFSDWKFGCQFPFAEITYSANDFPAEITLSAFNPFIPMDEDNSSIPAAFFELNFRNTSNEDITYMAAFSIMRPFEGGNARADIGVGNGLFMKSTQDEQSPEYRDMTLVALDGETRVQQYWYRGSWKDSVTMFWKEFSEQNHLSERVYEAVAPGDCGTVYSDITLKAGESKSIRFLLSWNAPNCINYWKPVKDENGNDLVWKNYYATKWKNSLDSCLYAATNWDSLKKRSRVFSDELFSSTFDPVFIDRAAANLSVLKSPTVLRLSDGTLWGWEGVHEKAGSCEGSCSHVWNYAYALPFLFPRLERSMREADYRYNQFENGMMAFRIKLPLGVTPGNPRPCVDGQMGGIIKTYRDWKYSGNTEWLRSIWPRVRKAMEYAWIDDGISSWDADQDGVLEGKQHHTLDMELFGPSAWLEGMYLAALKAAAEMASALGEQDFAEFCRSLFQKGSKWTEEHLFNGKYYIQKVDLHDRNLPERFGDSERYWNEEVGEIKYQIADGCEIDQLCGQWHAELCGLGDIFSPEHRKIALQNMWNNNYKTSVRNIANSWRAFAINDEAGTIMCDYPEGCKKPAIPIPYCEECMTGFEYALAELMLAHGKTEEGTAIVYAVSGRYDGAKRNPFNEIECGSNYARSMASWGLIPILSGFRYNLTQHSIGFFPRVREEHFRSFWSCGEAWGRVEIEPQRLTLYVTEGTLLLRELECKHASAVINVTVNDVKSAFSVGEDKIKADILLKSGDILSAFWKTEGSN